MAKTITLTIDHPVAGKVALDFLYCTPSEKKHYDMKKKEYVSYCKILGEVKNG